VIDKERPGTTPHDYRVVCEHEPNPAVVGGQAVNLWAVNYLSNQVGAEELVSKDRDIIVEKDGLASLRRVPGWAFQPRATRNWMDSRLGALRSTSPDGRPLLVEILHSVHGLDKADLVQAAYLKTKSGKFRVLDPIAMLKAKAANVRDIDQVGPPARQDRAHLHLVARCLPLFLRDVHQSAVADSTREKEALTVVSRAFKALQNVKTAQTLLTEGIASTSLIPAEFETSPLPRIRSAYEWQFRLLTSAAARLQPGRSSTTPASRPQTEPPQPPPRQGPRMGI
jgi:hypothetical protein